MRNYLKRFLIFLLPNRRKKPPKFLIEMMETDEEYGLYDEPFKTEDK